MGINVSCKIIYFISSDSICLYCFMYFVSLLSLAYFVSMCYLFANFLIWCFDSTLFLCAIFLLTFSYEVPILFWCAIFLLTFSYEVFIVLSYRYFFLVSFGGSDIIIFYVTANQSLWIWSPSCLLNCSHLYRHFNKWHYSSLWKCFIWLIQN